MKVLIPMAGEGRRFQEAGYTFPKPLIEVGGKPMMQRVIENLLPLNPSEFVFLVKSEHAKKYAMRDMLRQVVPPSCDIRCFLVDELTEGAACTALLAKEFIDDDEDLLIANSDQLMNYSALNFALLQKYSLFDGIVFCFNSTHPKWSFVKVDPTTMLVTEVAEKKPISDIATCGVYYYGTGRLFVKAAENMIDRNIRVNGEFYIAPVYNEMIAAGKKIVPFMVEQMHGLGTPEDLDSYLDN